MVGCGFFPDAVVGRELFFLPWPSLSRALASVKGGREKKEKGGKGGKEKERGKKEKINAS